MGMERLKSIVVPSGMSHEIDDCLSKYRKLVGRFICIFGALGCARARLIGTSVFPVQMLDGQLRQRVQGEGAPGPPLRPVARHRHPVRLAAADHEDADRLLSAHHRRHEAVAAPVPANHQLEEGGPAAVVRHQYGGRQAGV